MINILTADPKIDRKGIENQVQAYEQVNQKRGNGMRTELTNLINQTIERTPGNDPRTNTDALNEQRFKYNGIS